MDHLVWGIFKSQLLIETLLTLCPLNSSSSSIRPSLSLLETSFLLFYSWNMSAPVPPSPHLPYLNLFSSLFVFFLPLSLHPLICLVALLRDNSGASAIKKNGVHAGADAPEKAARLKTEMGLICSAGRERCSWLHEGRLTSQLWSGFSRNRAWFVSVKV